MLGKKQQQKTNKKTQNETLHPSVLSISRNYLNLDDNQLHWIFTRK